MTGTERTSTGAAFTMRRELAAPRELVFDAWTLPERLQHWWGPEGFTAEAIEADVRPGGRFLYCLRSPEGAEMWGKWEFREVVAPERLVFVSAFADDQGATIRAPFGIAFPMQVLSTVTFEAVGDRTVVHLHAVPLEASAEETQVFDGMHDSMRGGWSGTFAQLDEYLAETERELILSREFAAPPEVVFSAWTEPERVAAWWGPRGFTTTIREMDVRPGGTWRFVMHGPDGTDYPNRVVYREVVAPERLVYEHSDDRDDNPRAFEVTVNFWRAGTGTRLTMRTLFPTMTALEEVKGFGAVELGQSSLECLAEYLEGVTV